jgi:hypothetical protein
MPDAQGREAILESVDLFVPMAPASVMVAGKTHIVYELHITNFLLVDVSITRIQVKSAGPLDASIADYRDSEVSRRIGRPGQRLDQANPQVVGPGMRAVIYLWIVLPEGSVTPQALGAALTERNSRVHSTTPLFANSLDEHSSRRA